MPARQHPQDGEQLKDIAKEQGKRRIRKATNTGLELPHAALAEEHRESGAGPAAQNHGHQRRQSDEPDYAACSRCTDGRSESLRLRWSVRLCFIIAAIAISFYLVARHLSLSPFGRGIDNPPLEDTALTESPPIILATELGEHLDVCISQIWHMITILQSSCIDVFLPPTFSKELEDLEDNMDIALYPKYQPELNTVYLLYRMSVTDEECVRIDASFNKYRLDQYHDLQTLLCVYTQDTINNFHAILSTANTPVSKPFFSSYERAALLKAKEWSYTTSELSTEVNITVTHLAAIGTGLLTSILTRVMILATHLFNATALGTQHHPFIGIRTLLGLSPTLSTSSAVKLTAALEVVTNTARTLTHFLYSIDTALATLTKLQRVLEAGPWANTHVVTVEQWDVQGKEMCAWMLEVKDCITDLGVGNWEQFDWGYYWYFEQRCLSS